MNLTLFPVAAFLLLLSGIGAPAHAAGQMETSAALMRALLDGWKTAPTGMPATARCLRQFATQPARTHSHGSTTGARDSWSEARLARHVAAAPGASEKKQYRTRFGFAGGAYLAAAPPDFGSRPGPVWHRS